MGNSVNLSEWVYLKTTNGAYLGKVSAGQSSAKAATLECMLKGQPLVLCPVFESLSPFKQVQDPRTGQVALQRDPIIPTFEFTVGEVPVSLNGNQITLAMFGEDLKSEDAETYTSFINQSLDLLLQSRARKAGIHLVGGGLSKPNV